MQNKEQLKTLREQTGISILECKKALEEAQGDLKRAKEILREKGQEMLKGRDGRAAEKGRIDSYIHAGGKVGVLLKLSCESDFAAKSDDFKKLAHEICLHITAANPLFVKAEDIPEEFLEEEKKIYQKQMADSGKPQEILGKVIEGKLNKYKKEVSLSSQPWVKDPSKTIEQLIEEARAKIGEKIDVSEFTRYQV